MNSSRQRGRDFRSSLRSTAIYVSGLILSLVAAWAISAHYDRLLILPAVAVWLPFLTTGLRSPARTSFAPRNTLASDLIMAASGVLLSVGVVVLSAYVNAGERMPTPIEGTVGGAMVLAGATLLVRMLFFTPPRVEGDRS
ncbi:hypothetical protein ACFXQA_11320 [Microbacterium sp. P07]|uniref:hypothetical protein n=1 Tax=Microbacterium sp. P07 TaxID=3366952 RepID=UPI003745C31E